MSEIKWRQGPVPECAAYITKDGRIDFNVRVLSEGYIPRGEWILAAELNSLPVEEPPLPPVEWRCDKAPYPIFRPLQDELVHCLASGHPVTLTQGDNTIILKGKS